MQHYIRRQKFIYKWKSFWQKHDFLPIFLLFIFAFCFLFFLQYSKSFADPDSFYHAKIIYLMQQKIINGQLPIFKQFPWLYYTVLGTNYIDHHFLYHLLSIPCLVFAQLLLKLPLFAKLKFTNGYSTLIGFKLATIEWGSSFITIFYWILKKIKIKGAIFYGLLLLIINPFVFRLSLGKATAASLIFLFIGIYFIIQKKIWPLFFISFFYVWLYGGWPLMLVVVGVFVVSDAIINTVETRQCLISVIRRGSASSLLLATTAGLLAGLIINPYFPKNLIFYYHQIYQIAILNYKNILNVGAEWYPYNFFELLSASSPIFLLTIPAIILFIGNMFHFSKNKNTATGAHCNTSPQCQKQNFQIKILLFSFILSILFLGLTLRSRRNVEYFFPFLTLFIASSFTISLKNFYKPINWQTIYRKLTQKWLTTGVLSGFFIVAIPFIIFRDISTVKKELSGELNWKKWQPASEWLKNNTQKNEIIFHNDWDDWPFLFFHNENNRYIVGLDPTFMYNFDRQLYQEWSDATLGQNTQPLDIILKKFNSKYILVDNQHLSLENQIILNDNFIKVFSDSETKIYKLKN